MSREYGRKLTREMLENWGIVDIIYLPSINQWTFDEKTDWYIKRKWRKNSSKQFYEKRINVTEAVCKHKYTSDRKYLKITFSIDGKAISLPLARVIYAWFIGPIEDKEVIDHIDNNPYNNHYKNLQKLSVGENLAKRYIDNPKFNVNQYGTAKSYR